MKRIPRKTPHTMTMPPIPDPPPRIIDRDEGNWFCWLSLTILVLILIAGVLL